MAIAKLIGKISQIVTVAVYTKSMFTPITPSATTLSELAAQVWNSGKISSQDRQFLRSLFTENFPSEEEIAAVDRLLHAIRRGWIKMLE